MESDKIRLITMIYEKSNEIFDNIFVFYKINDMFLASQDSPLRIYIYLHRSIFIYIFDMHTASTHIVICMANERLSILSRYLGV